MAYEFLPQPKSISRDDLLRGVLATLPPGGLRKDPDSNTYKIAQVIADSQYRLVLKMQEAQDQQNPRTATSSEALPDWEQAILDPKCYDLPNLTEDAKQLLLIQQLRGGLANLTAAQLQTRLGEAFTSVVFTVTEEFTQRYGVPKEYGNSNYTRAPFVRVAFNKGSLTDSAVELIRCFVSALLPVTTEHAVNVTGG